MDIPTVYEMVKELTTRVSVVEQNLAAVNASVAWLEWWMRALITGTFLNIAVAGFNSILLVRNGRK